MSNSFHKKIVKLIFFAEDFLRISTIAAMVLLIFLQVILRIIFQWGSPIWEEASRFLLVWSIMAGIMVTTRNDEHIKIELFQKLISSPKIKLFHEVIVKTTCLIFFCIFTYWSWDFLVWSIRSKQQSYLLSIPMFPVHAAFLICGSISVLHLFFHLKTCISSLITTSKNMAKGG